MNLNLDSYRISSLNIINEKAPSANQEMKMSFQYGIRMDSSSTCSVKCIGILRLPEEDNQDNKTFYVKMAIEGFFTHKGEDKDLLRKEGAGELLPLLRSHICTAMASVGLDPIIIPLASIKAFNDMTE